VIHEIEKEKPKRKRKRKKPSQNFRSPKAETKRMRKKWFHEMGFMIWK
jgi:hypothetical protein